MPWARWWAHRRPPRTSRCRRWQRSGPHRCRPRFPPTCWASAPTLRQPAGVSRRLARMWSTPRRSSTPTSTWWPSPVSPASAWDGCWSLAVSNGAWAPPCVCPSLKVAGCVPSCAPRPPTWTPPWRATTPACWTPCVTWPTRWHPANPSASNKPSSARHRVPPKAPTPSPCSATRPAWATTCRC